VCMTRILLKNLFFIVTFRKSTAILAFEQNFFMDADLILVEHTHYE
jgi:hypothetical protein